MISLGLVGYIAAAAAVVILGMAIRIDYLNYKVDKAQVALDMATVTISKYEEAERTQLITIEELQESLDTCIGENTASDKRATEAIKSFTARTEQAQREADKNVQRIRESLEGETCASTPLPADTMRALRSSVAQ